MYPLRKKYTRRLMHEVGFQHIETYGDFQETFKANDPDFLVQVLGEAIKAGATTLNIPDTVGYTTPEEFGGLIKYLIFRR